MKASLVLAALLGGGCLLVVAVDVLSPSSAVYSFGVAQFLAKRGFDKPVRVKGKLVPGTLCKVEPSCGYRFSLVEPRQPDSQPAAPDEMLSVVYDGCVLPDTFRDIPGVDLLVTVSGRRCRTCHALDASSVMMSNRFSPYDVARDSAPYVTQRKLPRCQSQM